MSSYDRDYFRRSGGGGFGGFSFLPPVIKSLLVINVVVYLIQMSASLIGLDRLITLNFGLIPLDFPYASFMPWQLITYQFLHGGFFHILFNMFMLWMFGLEIENLWGSKKFLWFYLLSGVGAGLFQLLLSPMFEGSGAPTIGASGSVYGVMIAFAMFFPDRYLFVIPFPFPVKAKYLITFFIIIEFFSVGGTDFVAHMAHLGGAAIGFLLVYLDKNLGFNIVDYVEDLMKKDDSESPKRFRKPLRKEEIIEEADFHDISEKEINQAEIDRILDKISKSGYKNLTDDEKRILFEASKRE